MKPFGCTEIPVNGLLRNTPRAFYPSKLFAKTQRRKKTEVLIEPFIRKQLRLKAHTVTHYKPGIPTSGSATMICEADAVGKSYLMSFW